MAAHPKISKAKSRLMFDSPFFASLLVRTQVEITTTVPLAATDGDRIYLNPDFLEQLSIDDVITVLAHEVGHDCLLHSIRLGARSPDITNMAMDHAINLMLIDQGFKCPASVPGGWLADPKYKGMNWERIYDDLRRNPPPPQAGKSGSGEGSGSPGRAPQNASGGTPGPQQAGRDWLHGDVLPKPVKDVAEQAAAEQRAKQRVAAAASMARMAGKLTGELARMVDDMLEARIPWTEVLREYMTRIVHARDNWSRRNRRFQGIYLPTRRSQEMGPIIFVPDTSGSMWGDDLEKICSEIAHCSMQTRPEHIRVVWADSSVKGEQLFSPDEFAFGNLKPVGGGGTDMRVPLKHVEQYEPQVVVLLTDGETPWPANPCPFPVICICTTSARCPDWMEVIRI